MRIIKIQKHDKRYLFLLSIPLELRDGNQQYAQCSMFSRNYTDIIRTTVSAEDLMQLVLQYDDRNAPQQIACQNGWNYDRHAFPNTVVMEVRYIYMNILNVRL